MCQANISIRYVNGLEEKSAALEAELLGLKAELAKKVSQREFTPVTAVDIGSSAPSEQPYNFDVFAEHIARLLVDPSGHARTNTLPISLIVGYIGDSAGAAYVDRIRAFVKDSLYPEADFSHYLNYYHTWDSRPIPFVPRDPYGLPDRSIATTLISSFYANYPPELYYLVHPSALSQNLDTCFQDPGQNHTVLALVNAALALGAQTFDTSRESLEPTPGMEYFAHVKLLLATVCEDNNILSIQILNILVRSQVAL
jgi:hypothetical protein